MAWYWIVLIAIGALVIGGIIVFAWIMDKIRPRF
jgi:hypothetical protein